MTASRKLFGRLGLALFSGRPNFVIRNGISLAIAVLFVAVASGARAGDEPAELGWTWVQKVDSGSSKDDTATALTLTDDGVWIGGETLDSHYLQKFSPGGQLLTRRIRLGKGDSVNDLATAPEGEICGVADIHTGGGQRPALFFTLAADGSVRRTRLATTTPNGSAGYADAYGVAVSGQWAYASGYLRPEDYGARAIAYFGDKPLNFSGENLPEGSYAAFLAKIEIATGRVQWVRAVGGDTGETVKADNRGNIYVAGPGYDPEGPGFVRSYREDGSPGWQKSTESYVNSLVLDTNGDVWASNLGASSKPGTLQKFHRDSGDLLLSVQPPFSFRCLAVGAHPLGGIVALCHGERDGPNGSEMSFGLHRIDAGGNIVWSKFIAGGLAFRGYWSKVVVRSDGAIFAALSSSAVGTYSVGNQSAEVVTPKVVFDNYPYSFAAAGLYRSVGFVACLNAGPLSTGNRQQRVSFRLPAKIYVNQTYLLAAQASSRLPITGYAVSNTNSARIEDGRRLRILGSAPFQVVASQAGDPTWAPMSFTNAVSPLN